MVLFSEYIICSFLNCVKYIYIYLVIIIQIKDCFRCIVIVVNRYNYVIENRKYYYNKQKIYVYNGLDIIELEVFR